MDTPWGVDDLDARLGGVSLRDARRLGRTLARLRRGEEVDERRLAADLAAAEARVARRRAAVPIPAYPPELPVSQHREELLAAIAAHQVVVVAGETGSGKTTQLPKLCLELGRGVRGMIGHTQPRRIAARTVAERIAEECGVPLGGAVGYAVRFNDRVGDETLVKLMTDGILLAELPRDRDLLAYDTIVVDEAHERSLNIDFLLGYLSSLLPRRPDLKVVITSATIDTARFAAHFGGAPVVEVSGRTYPVEIRYEPVADEAGGRDRDLTEAIVDAVGEVLDEAPGDVLVFLSGEREIRDTAEALRGADLPGTEVLPLYARLAAAEQHRVFRPHPGRRVVLATNVAETSITVPGIRAVVDPGSARISRYNARTKVQRLPIERISRASADQRAGRCGRVGPGVCIRLYSEDDYDARPEFTDPEIARTNLASVVLQMLALGLGDVESFPFVDPPDRRQVNAAVDLLEELGAVTTDRVRPRRLTPVGRRLARLPVDPRLGRMILEAEREGCGRDAVIVTAGLSIQDPREYPSDERQAAAESHRRFADPDSDFVALLNLWEYLQEQQRELSGSAFRRRCRREWLNFQRVREWEDLSAQLRQVARDLGIRLERGGSDRSGLHRAVLAGLLSQIGVRDDDRPSPGPPPREARRRRPERPRREYAGARGTRFTLGSGSSLARHPPRWVMAAELVETDRLWARRAARIDPAWAERLGEHLLSRSWSEPRWDRRRAGTVATLRATLYGVPVVEGRTVDYSSHDPALARALFIRHALVEGDWDAHHRFLADNAAARRAVVALEERVRRRDLLADDDVVAERYEERVPVGVTTGRRFDRWWRDAARTAPGLLDLSPADLVAPGAGRIRFEDYPDRWEVAGRSFELAYRYDPTADDDGVTVVVPLAALPGLRPDPFDWQIPGYRRDLVAALLRLAPRELRRLIGPAPEQAAAFCSERGPDDGPLLGVLASWLAGRTGRLVSATGWDLDVLPGWLRPGFAVVDGSRRVLARSKDLTALQRRLQAPLRAAVAAAAGLDTPPATDWVFGTIPRVVEVEVAGSVLKAFPGLVADGGGAALRVSVDEHDRDLAMRAGTRQLLLVGTNPPVARAARDLPTDAKLALSSVPHGSLAAFLEDCAGAAVDALLEAAGGPVWDRPSWDGLLGSVRAGLPEATRRVVTRAALAVSWARALQVRVDRLAAPALAPAATDLQEQLDRLVGPGFVTRTGAGRLIDLVRYLRAAERRLDKLGEDPRRDRERMRPIRELQAELAAVTGRAGFLGDPEVDELWWMLEELRVATWAQSLGVAAPVSESRIRRAVARLRP